MRRSVFLRLLVVGVLVSASTMAGAGSGAAAPGTPNRGEADCGGFEPVEVAGRGTCTHGPDPIPAGAERSPSLSELRRRAVSDADVACLSSHTTGFRVQAIYARASDVSDGFTTLAPLIRSYAAQVDQTYAASAAETKGKRLVRFVTEAAPSGGCQVKVLKVTLTAAGDDSFANTVAELVAKGAAYTRTDRKYLIWMDRPVGSAAILCGIGEFRPDDQPSVSGDPNDNDGDPAVRGLMARTDRNCWGKLGPIGGTNAGVSVEAHELGHTFGAVQNTAPHSTFTGQAGTGGHCHDEYDAMCYDDDGVATTKPLTYTCNVLHAPLLDCGHDDYFHTAPAAGTYLATRWNTAKSRFLIGTLAPLNDAFAAAAPVNGFATADTQPVLVLGSNGGATQEAASGEPTTAGQVPARSVWYKLAAAAGKKLSVDTQGSSFDTVLGVYTGSSVGTLTEVAANNNGHAGVTYSRVQINNTQATTYYIKVDGKGAKIGAIQLHVGYGDVPAPVITAFTPTTVSGGGTVDVSYQNLSGPFYVLINGRPAAGLTFPSTGVMRLTVAAGTPSGPIVLMTDGGFEATDTNLTVTS